MVTKNPRVVGYVRPENYVELQKFVEQQGLTELFWWGNNYELRITNYEHSR
ncbi:hypothetical protein F7734_53330 [Scytonema sp. UIC 10036]|uniref:hypothetical protein n=1 Tax=Scytonema sp. UIC 10036 TaxID=2304196 RepID=UPI0012DAD565|nr:hypothetical protein [Scytonema sp. UIC 10036]MUH00593.1 hypothetical protein [Scytonema sp. UIC 10036]